MARPYSVDLRERVVRAVESGASRRATAAKFEVSISFVVKLMRSRSEIKTVSPAAARRTYSLSLFLSVLMPTARMKRR